MIYRKIPKICPGAYIFQRPFLRGLFFDKAHLRREICVSKSIGLALQLEGNWPFLLCFSLYLRAISKKKPPGGSYSEGWFKGGFFALRFCGTYIWRGLFSEFYGMLDNITWRMLYNTTWHMLYNTTWQMLYNIKWHMLYNTTWHVLYNTRHMLYNRKRHMLYNNMRRNDTCYIT